MVTDESVSIEKVEDTPSSVSIVLNEICTLNQLYGFPVLCKYEKLPTFEITSRYVSALERHSELATDL